ncbi:3-deoxy-7-phosphoheptulonate synthase [Salinibacter sp. 10B]|uniref:class II 3-deoxy-7-phosphoheptulonate synthase n=1 Tax=Salinibacter sp. 10B TaxID=1923971 RepID=UPI000CF42494|nr:3-deoxy-7-phosphoheptulonate synthase class II [Salinibacter sp. 10B]PQJ35462.1 3-deoxy-7-phosphoheptulonate synthase [Salinibacter sp. 10B]
MAHDVATDWTLSSWRAKEALQQPTYSDEAALDEALDHVSSLPPLVTSWEVENLKEELARAAHGERFLLQGGECAESFQGCTADVITSRLKILMQMSLVLTYGLNTRIVRVGRFAGQYAKPRSSDTETRNGTTLPSYRGDIVNSVEFTAEAREPDPQRMVEAYASSSLTLNLVRALVKGGFADLRHPEYWDLDFMQHSPLAEEYHAMVDAIEDTLDFVEAVTNEKLDTVESVTFYTSHEALLLPYEEALSRTVPHKEGVYNLGTHLPWVGKRTNQPENAHVEYARGIENPIGLKVGPDMTPSTLKRLVRTLDPEDEPGKLTLITRFGNDKIADRLPGLINAVRDTGQTVLWICDPMHGNTEKTDDGTKTRRFDNILGELEQALDIHAAEDSYLGGVHFELTGENVTECIGGARGLSEADLGQAYESPVDPRLNYEQSLEMAFSIVRKYRELHR